MSLLMGSGLLHTVTAGFTPLDLPNLKAWLATLASSDTTLVNTDQVSVWVDRETSGAPGNWTQGTAAARPVRTTGAEIAFDGVDDELQSGVTLSSAFSNLAEFGVFCVVRVKSNSTDDSSAWENSSIVSDAGGYFGLQVRRVTSPFELQAYVYSGGQQATATRDIAINTWGVAQFWHDGVNVNIQLDGGAVDSVAQGAVDDGSTNLVISSSAFYTVPADIDLRDVVLIDGVPSAQDRADYLSWAQGAYGV